MELTHKTLVAVPNHGVLVNFLAHDKGGTLPFRRKTQPEVGRINPFHETGVIFLRPLRRRRAITFALVLLEKNPCLRARRRFLGW